MSTQHFHVRPLGVEEADGIAARESNEVDSPSFDNEQGQEVEDDEVLEQAIEDHEVKAAPDPGQPSRAEVARHRLTHLPFRPWCPDCVRGRAPDNPHVSGQGGEEEQTVPKVSVDYAFMSLDDDEEVRTILTMKARPSKIVAAKCVKGKGRADPSAVPWLVEQLRRLGLARCVLQADGEPAQRTFVKDVIEEAARVSNIGVAQAHSPAYDHKANGDVERAVREVKNQVRVLHSSLVRNVGKIPTAKPIFEWLVEWAGELISGALVSRDGMTAVRRLRGKDWAPKIAEFGEQVLMRRPRALEQGSVEPRWDPSAYLGAKWGTAEHWVASSAIRRRPEASRWVAERVLRRHCWSA